MLVTLENLKNVTASGQLPSFFGNWSNWGTGFRHYERDSKPFQIFPPPLIVSGRKTISRLLVD